MNSMDLLDAIGDAKGAYVLAAREPVKRRRPVKRVWLIAAVIGVMLLLVGCAVVYVLSLKDMAFGEEVQEYYDGSSQNRTLLSLQGVEGTPGYQASKEWYEWLQTYDTDMTVYHSEEAFSEDFGDDYYAYNLYSREMKDKVDEICAKYGLELLGKMYVDPDVEAACQALKIQGILRPGAQAETDWGNIRYYANGSFKLEGHMTLTGENTPWPYTQIVSFDCNRKDAFSNLYESVGPVGSYEEWTYTTSDGVDVLMVIEKEQISGHSFMIVDRGPYVFLFSTYAFDDGHPMSKEGLEAFAEVFDFTVEPQRVSREDLEAAGERREIADQEWAEEYEKKMLGYQEKGYDARIKFQIENCVNSDQLGFTLMDIDGNGVDDLLVGQNGYLRAAYTFEDGGTQHMIMQRLLYEGMVNYDGIGVNMSMDPSSMYLCQDGSLAFAYDSVEGTIGYHFARAEGGKLVWAEQVVYDPVHHPDSPWQQYDADYRSTPITQAQFEQIVASHVRKPVELFPISEFPLTDDSPSGIGMSDPVYHDYAELIRAQTEWDADRSGWFYCRLDLDEDGQKELFLQEGVWKGVLTIAEGKVKLLTCGEELSICQGNSIALTRSYPDGNQTHCFYRVEDGNAVLIEYLRYDKDVNPDNPWFRSADASGQDISMEPISEAEFDAIRGKFTPAKLEWKPISEFPLD